jgi:hypothetical protein
VGHKISALVGDRNIHRLADFRGLLFGSRYNPSCIVECQSDLLGEL